jgi:predicted MFS family arabinose efflux permease
VLTQAANWHWIFFVNVPVGLAAVLLAGRVVAPDRAVPGGAGGGAGPRRAAGPRRLLRLVGTRVTGGANLVQALMIAAMMGFQFMFALYLQRVLGYRPAQVGAAFLPIAAAIGGLSLVVSPRLNSRFGPRAVLLVGLALIATGLGLLARVPSHAAFLADLLPVVLLLGAGAGLTLPAVMMLAMSGVDEADAGLASGLINTVQQVGGFVGVWLLAALDGYRAAFGAAAGLALAALAVVAAVVPARSGRRGGARSEDAAPDVVSSAL